MSHYRYVNYFLTLKAAPVNTLFRLYFCLLYVQIDPNWHSPVIWRTIRKSRLKCYRSGVPYR